MIRGLFGSEPAAEWARGGGSRRGDDGSGVRRGVLYFLAGGALAVGAFSLPPPDIGPAGIVIPLLAAVAATLYVVVGTLAVGRWGMWGSDVHFFAGMGFLGGGVLLAAFLLAAMGIAPATAPEAGPAWEILLSGAIASRTFLAACLVAGVVAWRWTRRRHPPTIDRWHRWLLLAVALALTGAVLLPAAAAPPGWPLSGTSPARPLQLVPALLFACALAGFGLRRTWRQDPVEHGLVVALVFGLVQHGALLTFVTSPDDPQVASAFALEVAGIGAVFVGLLAVFGRGSRRPGDAPGELLGVDRSLVRSVAGESGAERVLRESERRLRDFLDHANDLIQSTAPDGQLLYVNETWKRTLGYTDRDLRGLDIFSIVHPDHRRRFHRAFERVLAGESMTHFDVSFLTRRGDRVLLSGSSNCRFENGEPVATRSIFRNVTEQRRTERELAASQANLRALFESTGDPIWSVDRACRLITFNSAYALTVEAITGREPEAGDPVEEVVAPVEVDWFRACYRRALAGNRFSAVRQERVDRTTRSYELFFNPIEGSDGVSGVVVFSKDITRRKEVEEALRRAKQEAEEGNQAKSQFMASMSHELRTPLNSVIGFANILLKDPDERLEDREREFLERILANGKHLLGLINEVLDLSKIEAGRMDVALEDVDLGALVEETLSQVEGQVGAKALRLRADLPDVTAPLETDRGKLKQILINLVGNAMKFTDEGEVVVAVETGPDGRTPLRLAVSDTGVGIPEARLQAIFEAFQQADGGTARRFGGTGLGLTISRSLCHLLGYGLTVDSREGEGSTFTVLLEGPEGDPDGAAADASTLFLGDEGEENPGWPGLAGRRILVVDDDPDGRRLLRHFLEEAGGQAVLASSAEEARELAREGSFHLVTLDPFLGGDEGLSLLRALKADTRLVKLPVVLVSMAGDDGAAFLGEVDILDKPITERELLVVVNRNLRRRQDRILVVDDDPHARLVLRGWLRDHDFRVEVAGNGREALARLDRFEPDLVLLDLVMPEMDGVGCMVRLRGRPESVDTPVVVLAEGTLDPEVERGLRRRMLEAGTREGEVEERLEAALQARFGGGAGGNGRSSAG